MIADVHIEHGCGKTICPATRQIGCNLSSGLVVGTLEGLIEYITCRISISAQQSAKIAHLHRIGVHRASAALAFLQHANHDVISILVGKRNIHTSHILVRCLVLERPFANHLPFFGSAGSNLCLGIRQRIGKSLFVALLPVGILIYGVIILAA